MAVLIQRVSEHFRDIDVSEGTLAQLAIIFDVYPVNIRDLYSAAMNATTEGEVQSLIKMYYSTDTDGIHAAAQDYAERTHGVSSAITVSQDELSQLPVVTDKMCRQCRVPNTIVSLTRQARRADEGATTFYLCRQCLSRWKD